MRDELAAMLTQISGGDSRDARHEKHVIDIRNPDMRRRSSDGTESRLRDWIIDEEGGAPV